MVPPQVAPFDFMKNFHICNKQDILKIITCPPLIATSWDIDALPSLEFGSKDEVNKVILGLQNARIKRIKDEYEPLIAAIGCEHDFLVGNPLGGPRIEVPKLATECGAELLVVGSRGLKGLKSFMLGSVADASVHHAHCNVLVCKGFEEDEEVNEFSIEDAPYIPGDFT